MISFKRFLQEKYIHSTSKEWEMMIYGYFPLSDWLYKEMEREIPITFRTSYVKGLKSLYKYQGQKKQIPVFTKGSEGIARGAIMRTEVLVQLSGKSALEFPLDAGTSVDRNGKRWITPNTYELVRNYFSIPILNRIDDYLRDYFGLEKVQNPFLNIDERIEAMESMSGSEKQKFISWYYKEAKDLITKDFIKALSEDIGKGYAGDFGNDEILLHDYKIEKIWAVEEYLYDTYLIYGGFRNEYNESGYDDPIDFVQKEKKKEFNKWFKGYLKDYPKMCKNTINRGDIEKIDVSKNKYPKVCK